MSKRLRLNTLFMSVIPLISMLAVVKFRDSPDISWYAIAAIGILLQIPVIIVCKRNVRNMFQPSLKILRKMRIQGMTCAYDPGRFKADFRVVGVFLWFGTIAPLLTGISIELSEIHTVAVLNFATYTGPNMPLLFLSILILILGIVSLPLWVKFGQAMVVFNEVSEGRRYLYRGYAEVIETGNYFKTYQRMEKKLNEKK